MITDEDLAFPRTVQAVVKAALGGGAPAIQLRDKHKPIRELLTLARELRELTREHDALFFVNDRLDLALAAGADGVHLGPDDLPVAAVRAAVPDWFFVGYSTDDPRRARQAVAAGADYIGCGTVWATGSKDDAGAAIGLKGVAEVVHAVSVPVVAIGGISVERAPELRETNAAGMAVMSAVMTADDPATTVRLLLNGFDRAR